MAHQTHTITWSLRTFSPIERKQETQTYPCAPAHTQQWHQGLEQKEQEQILCWSQLPPDLLVTSSLWTSNLCREGLCAAFTQGADPTEPAGPSIQVTYFGFNGDMIQTQTPWGHPAGLYCRPGDITKNFHSSLIAWQRSCLWANWRAVLLEEVKLH